MTLGASAIVGISELNDCNQPEAATPRSVLQREEPVGAGGRTHAIRHQADARLGHQWRHERRLCEVQLTSDRDLAGALRR